MLICLSKPAACRARGFFIAYISLFLLFFVGCTSQQSAPPTQGNTEEVVFNAMQQVGRPYRYGGSSPQTGFDCSGLIHYSYQQALGIATPRTVKAIYSASYPNIEQQDLQPGDIVVFATNWKNKPDHAGIYVGKQRFVHAPSSGGVVQIDPLNRGYWQKNFLTGKRVPTLH